MIPKLFYAPDIQYDSEGVGRLTDALSVSVKEKLNGEYTMTMEYPMDGVLASELSTGHQIVVTPSYGHAPEPFDVKSISVASSSGKVTIKCQHISYRLNKYAVMPFEAVGPAAALTGLINNAAESCPFTVYTNKTGTGAYRQIVPASIRSRLGGSSGSILDVFGGEYEFSKYAVRLLTRRGSDTNVEIRYGKNLIDANQEKSIANTLTGICPYWSKETDGEIQTVTLPEKVLLASTAGNYPYPLTRPVDLSNEFDDKPTQAQLRTRAQRYLDDNVSGVPDINIKVSFVVLADTEQYANIAPLETVHLGDTVRVYFEQLGIHATARIIETDYDPLRERYNSVTIGNVKNTISDIIVKNAKDIRELSDQVQTDLAGQYAQMQTAIDAATAALTGQNGGHLRFGLGADGEPNEMYIMDTDDASTAQKVWRYNLAGWGVSTTGINGPYTMAATLESGFIADFITAGTINANDVSIINLIVDHLRSYNSDQSTMLESEASYLDIRDYDSATQAWRQRVGIFSTAGGRGAIRVSGGAVDQNGQPIAGQSSRRTMVQSNGIWVCEDENGVMQGTVHTKGAGKALATTVINAVGNTWTFDCYDIWAFEIEASKNGVGATTMTIPVSNLTQFDKIYAIYFGTDAVTFKAKNVDDIVTIEIATIASGITLISARGII